MALPLMEVLAEHGPLKAKDAASAIAAKLQLPEGVTSARIHYSGGNRSANVFERRVRWTKQTAVEAGLVVTAGQHGVWDLTDRGHRMLTMARPSVCIEVFSTDLGAVLFAEAKTALTLVEHDSIQLCLTSSPFPLVVQRPYGGWGPETFLETLLDHLELIRPLLRVDGSLVLNLGDVYEKGRPTLFPYQEALVVEMVRRNWCLCSKFIHVNPSKPKTTNYVTKSRERVANGFETYWHFSPSSSPRCDNRRVLEPYSEKHRRTIANGGETRRTRTGSRQTCPGLRYRADNGGRIPYNVITCAHEASNSPYVRFCRENALPLHPARMPIEAARFFIRYASEAGSRVLDPFAGSLVVPAACEELGREYVAIEKCMEYLAGGGFRIRSAPGFVSSNPFDGGETLVSGLPASVISSATANDQPMMHTAISA